MVNYKIIVSKPSGGVDIPNKEKRENGGVDIPSPLQ